MRSSTPDMQRRGFTLVELMVVVAIIGLLAAIAIPSFVRFQLRSKTAEPMMNLRAISKAQSAYFAEWGTYVSVNAPVPATSPGSVAVEWPAGTDFEILGWQPEGRVFFQYRVGADDAVAGPRYTAEAGGDLDTDTEFSFFAFVKPPKGSVLGLDGALPGSTCLGTGVFDHGSGAASQRVVVGPCDITSGRSKF